MSTRKQHSPITDPSASPLRSARAYGAVAHVSHTSLILGSGSFELSGIGAIDPVGFSATAVSVPRANDVCAPGFSGTRCDRPFCNGIVDVTAGGATSGVIRSQPAGAEAYAPYSQCGWRVHYPRRGRPGRPERAPARRRPTRRGGGRGDYQGPRPRDRPSRRRPPSRSTTRRRRPRCEHHHHPFPSPHLPIHFPILRL